jgi:tripartite-type tricarboxylate transporter receptor subunit TctC
MSAKFAAACAVVLTFAATPALAQSYPDRPITMIVPYAAGGSSDVLARLLAERLSPALGQPIVIDNRAGAGSRVGIELAARAPADGYTLLLADMPHTIIPAIQKGVRYDPVRDFTPIRLIGTASMVLFVNRPAQSPADLVALAKAEPGKVTIASGGIGSTTHLTAELFQAKTGAQLLHVPYRGAGPAINDLVAGHVKSGFTTLATASAPLDGGSIRALAIASRERLSSRPTIPTFKESGVDLVVEHWWGVLAPAGVPPAVASRLTNELAAILAQPDFAERLTPLGVTPSRSTSEQFRALLESHTARWADIVKSAGIPPQ